MYRDTFLMDQGDIVIKDDLIMARGQEELRQNVENRLCVNRGEWFLNIGLGLDYGAIAGKGIDDVVIAFAIRETCHQDTRVKEVRDIAITRDPKTRQANIEMTIVDDNDNPLYLNEVVEIG